MIIKLTAVFLAATAVCLLESGEEAVTVLALGQGSGARLVAASLGLVASLAIVIALVTTVGTTFVPEHALKFVAAGLLLAMGSWFLYGALR